MTKTLLELAKVNKIISKRKILDNIDIKLNDGDIMALIGENGAGKTSIMKLVGHLIHASSGTIVVDGISLDKQYDKALGKIGYIIETPYFYDNLTGYQNLKLRANILGISQENVMEVIKFSGLESRIYDKVKKYSLGMKQRLGLAMAILNKPKLLLLDEPMNGLDPLGVLELKKMLKTLIESNQMTILISSHNLLELDTFCNKVCVIKKGKVIYCGKIKTTIQDIFMKRIDNNETIDKK